MHDDRARAAAIRLVHLPTELEQALGGLGHSVLGPREEVELGDGAGLPGAQILQVERAHEVVVAPDVLRDQMHLVDVIELGALVRPVAMAHRLALLRQSRQHHDHHAALLPDELPEVGGGLGQRALRRYVRRVARVVVGLKVSQDILFFCWQSYIYIYN